MMEESTLCTCAGISDQFAVSTVAIPAAPIAIRPIPMGRLPLRARITPSASAAPDATRKIALRTVLILLFSISQLRAAAAPIETAPAIIKPIPSGTFAPLNASRAPTASRAPPITSVIALTAALTC